MSSPEDLAKLLSSASPSGVKARKVVVDRARKNRFKSTGVNQRTIHELITLSHINRESDILPDWAVLYEIEMKQTIDAMNRTLVYQQVRGGKGCRAMPFPIRAIGSYLRLLAEFIVRQPIFDTIILIFILVNCAILAMSDYGEEGGNSNVSDAT